MNLIAIIPSGQTEITVNGLHQWDYGRKLEIHSSDISAEVLIEVHFACAGMDTAIVRVSNIVSGVATVTIPDKCLEQTTPIVAWVFEVNDATKSGVTTKRINMPVEARPRPNVSEDIPQEVSDKYTEALTAINEAVADLKNGVVKVSNASHADEANKATLDGNGQTITSTYAKKTDLTSGAITVAKATKDGNGDTIASTYAKKTDLSSGAITVAKAAQDGDGNVIADTYAKETDLTSGAITVAKAATLSPLVMEVGDIGHDGMKVDLPHGKVHFIEATNALTGDHSIFVLSYHDTYDSYSYWYSSPCRDLVLQWYKKVLKCVKFNDITNSYELRNVRIYSI